MNERLKLFQEGYNNATSNTFSVIIFLVIVASAIALIVLYNYLKNKYKFTLFKKSNVKWSSFNSLARSVGLENDESKLLFNIVEKQNVKHPYTCFTNSKMLDDILRKALQDIENDKKLSDNDKVLKSYLILETKVKIENSLKKNIGIKSTHLLNENQKVILFIRGIGYFYATLIRNTKDFFTIELVSDKINKRIFRKNDYLKCYLWREDDAGYTFETEVVDFGDKVKVYNLAHSEKLVRTQKRKYRRIPVNFIGELFSVYVRIKNNKRVYSVGTKSNKGNIVDLSAGGLKMRVSDIDNKEKFVKIVFEIGKYSLNTIGKIIRLYDSNGVKDITVQFIKVSMKDRNIINEYVYNYFPGYN